MRFKKGDPKPPTSGRRPGVRNKKTYRLMEVLEELGLDPVKNYFEAISQIENPQARASELAKIFPYMMPRLATVTVSQKTPEQEEIEQMTTSELEAHVKQLLLGDKTNEAEEIKTKE
jgi:hypothetical protein